MRVRSTGAVALPDDCTKRLPASRRRAARDRELAVRSLASVAAERRAAASRCTPESRRQRRCIFAGDRSVRRRRRRARDGFSCRPSTKGSRGSDVSVWRTRGAAGRRTANRSSGRRSRGDSGVGVRGDPCNKPRPRDNRPLRARAEGAAGPGRRGPGRRGPGRHSGLPLRPGIDRRETRAASIKQRMNVALDPERRAGVHIPAQLEPEGLATRVRRGRLRELEACGGCIIMTSAPETGRVIRRLRLLISICRRARVWSSDSCRQWRSVVNAVTAARAAVSRCLSRVRLPLIHI